MPECKASYYDPDGPAVLLGTSSSIFPLQLARYWRSLGIPVAIVCRDAEDTVTEDGITVVSAAPYHPVIVRLLLKFYRILHWAELALVRLYRSSYRRSTGRNAPDPWEPYFVYNVLTSFGVAKAAKALKPRFVFGHEAGSYGLPSAYCKEVPSFVFPWGADVFLSVETSPLFCWIIKYALRNVDLVLPSSVTAAKHIAHRLEIDPGKVIPVSWGADLSLFRRAAEGDRLRILGELGIPSDAVVVTNPRRFRPAWGCFEALTAFMELARTRRELHFVMVGGLGAEADVEKALEILKQNDLLSRFTILRTDITISEFGKIMSVSDIFVSLLGRGDMRSSSVLQAAAAGAVPVIVDNTEYQEMTNDGFRSRFVSNPDPQQIREAVEGYLDDPAAVISTREANYQYLRNHEDNGMQMAKMLKLIEDVCLRYKTRVA